MAQKRSDSGFVDISSKTQVVKLYKKKGRIVRIVALVLSIIMIIAGAVIVKAYSTMDSVNYQDLEDIEDTDNTQNSNDDPGAFNTTVNDSDLLSDSKVLNVMLFGEDNHSKDTTGRSDSLMLMSIDNREKKLKLTSFQRDTLVYIPGHGYDKITTAYSYGGAALAIKTVEANFGIKIDRYAVVDFQSFQKIIDTLGGLKINLAKDEVEYINWQMYINKQTPERHLLEEKDGVITLTGQQALWYARDRGYDGIQAGDDWDRTKRQRKLINTVIKSMKNASMTELIDIITAVGPLITTNLKKSEITGLATHALTYVNYPMKSYTVPQKNLWSYYDDPEAGSCIQINDMKKCRKKLAKFLYASLLKDE